MLRRQQAGRLLCWAPPSRLMAAESSRLNAPGSSASPPTVSPSCPPAKIHAQQGPSGTDAALVYKVTGMQTGSGEAGTWKGRMRPVSRSQPTASQSSTTLRVPSVSRAGRAATMSGNLPVLFSLLRLRA